MPVFNVFDISLRFARYDVSTSLNYENKPYERTKEYKKPQVKEAIVLGRTRVPRQWPLVVPVRSGCDYIALTCRYVQNGCSLDKS